MKTKIKPQTRLELYTKEIMMIPIYTSRIYDWVSIYRGCNNDYKKGRLSVVHKKDEKHYPVKMSFKLNKAHHIVELHTEDVLGNKFRILIGFTYVKDGDMIFEFYTDELESGIVHRMMPFNEYINIPSNSVASKLRKFILNYVNNIVLDCKLIEILP
jgi:hypothetical protein